MKIFIIIKRTRKRPFNKSGCAVPFTAQTTTFKIERMRVIFLCYKGKFQGGERAIDGPTS